MKCVSHAALALAAAIAVAGAAWGSPSTFSQMERLAAGTLAIRVQEDCEDLRRACLDKDVIGEPGQGNCRRFRERCGVSRDYCARLLSSCLQKDALGAKGQRSCRHYRLECQA